GLQSIAKPLQRKLASGMVKKHSIIRALNKVYKRDVYFPGEEELNEVLSDEHKSGANTWEETTELNFEPDMTTVTTEDQSAKPPEQKTPSKDVLDFTQNFLQP
ncbi:hypothetical protein D036_2914, partial [Vibrio parahaemolyticus VP232]